MVVVRRVLVSKRVARVIRCRHSGWYLACGDPFGPRWKCLECGGSELEVEKLRELYG